MADTRADYTSRADGAEMVLEVDPEDKHPTLSLHYRGEFDYEQDVWFYFDNAAQMRRLAADLLSFAARGEAS